MRRFSVQLKDALYAPDYPEGSYIVMDPALPPEDGKFVLCATTLFRQVTRNAHRVSGPRWPRWEWPHFCKRGSPEEEFSFCPVKFRRDERYNVTVLGVEVGQLWAMQS